MPDSVLGQQRPRNPPHLCLVELGASKPALTLMIPERVFTFECSKEAVRKSLIWAVPEAWNLLNTICSQINLSKFRMTVITLYFLNSKIMSF